ncbi:MAG: recombination protein RecR [Elusimicrobia bacterium]|nr:recombination protein RecR [Elusimicrobiota bacterium]
MTHPILTRLVAQLTRLPGIGPKMAERIAFHLLRALDGEVEQLLQAIRDARVRLHYCQTCFNFTEAEECRICRDLQRKPELLCVVEYPQGVSVLERTQAFQGRYHVLHGALSPMDGVGPDQIKTKELLNRLQQGQIQEVILATDADVPGETTATYLAQLIKPLGVKVTRLGSGLPMGGNLEYADDVTLTRHYCPVKYR